MIQLQSLNFYDYDENRKLVLQSLTLEECLNELIPPHEVNKQLEIFNQLKMIGFEEDQIFN